MATTLQYGCLAVTTFNWLRQIQLFHKAGNGAPIGRFHPRTSECVQLRGSTSLVSGQRPRLLIGRGANNIVNPWFCLNGPTGALPYPFTEMLGRIRENNPSALSDFLDIFNHRTQSLLYRTLCKYLPLVNGMPATDVDTLKAALCGIPFPPRQAGEKGNDRHFDCFDLYSPFFAQRGRSAAGLCQLLRRQFDFEIEVREFSGGWHSIDECAQSRLGSRQGNKPSLGVATVIGRRACVPQAGVTVYIVASKHTDYARLENNSATILAIKQVAQVYVGVDVDVELKVVAKGALLPIAKLHASKKTTGSIRLGYGILKRARGDREITLATRC